MPRVLALALGFALLLPASSDQEHAAAVELDVAEEDTSESTCMLQRRSARAGRREVAPPRPRATETDEERLMPRPFGGAAEMLLRMFDLSEVEAYSAKEKSKVVLIVLQMIPVCGPLGVDRIYLGCWKTGVAKMVVCVLTCFLGGLIWNFLDTIFVLMNAIERRQSIHVFGLEAEFSDGSLNVARALAWVALVLNVSLVFGYGLCYPLARRCSEWLERRPAPKEPGATAAGPAAIVD